MSAPTRIATTRLRPPRLATTSRYFTASRSPSQGLQWPQRTPLGEYYTIILRNPILLSGHARNSEKLPSISDLSAPSDAPSKADDAVTKNPKASTSARENTTATPTTTSSSSSTRELTPQEKTRIIFGSRPRHLGPADQADKLAQKEAQSTYVAGVLVPPKPEEPDNCCMSGCVNCVWDRFREDMEEWTAKKHEAQAAADGDSGGTDGTFVTSAPTMGRNETIAEDAWDDEVYKGVPVGIREFMKQEKRLKERHAREEAVGG
ncbi:hypothetical protein E4U57_000822 [Claviceps arundinis]|uniref:Oxidoreductase-like domain-containing protein n=1 Tax=Claviceps arundinis TaxID=1623583 RepID=A0ABQ7PDY0_9HYPO|nr:hypothetical protein E4U57_000822 [Claviceps arundinis]